MSSLEKEYWIASGCDELKSLEDLKVFILVPRSSIPPGQHPLKGKLVCNCKHNDSGNIICYKVRYVAKGFAQIFGVNYDKTTAPTIRLESFRTVLHLAATLDWDIQHFDVKTAFLHGILPPDETMFMEQPHGFETPGKEDWVMKLIKSLYGMKQASHIWNQTFHKTVKSWGFQCVPCDGVSTNANLPLAPSSLLSILMTSSPMLRHTHRSPCGHSHGCWPPPPLS